MNPSHDPKWFRLGFWILWHPAVLIVCIVAWTMLCFALGRWTRPV